MIVYVMAFVASDPRSKHRGSLVLLDGEGYWTDPVEAEAAAEESTAERREEFQHGSYVVVSVGPNNRDKS